jgi:two-component system sensor histidine kinase DevS
VTVEVTATPNTLTVRVEDDGRGFPEGGRRSGLENMRRRAERHGGGFTVGLGSRSGTALSWSVPIGER